MPYLESPEVFSTEYNSGLVTLEQKPAAQEQVAGYETDTGLTGAMGLNPVCTRVQLFEMPVSNSNHADLALSLTLSQEWHGKDAFIASMKEDHGVIVEERKNDYTDGITMLTVRGPANILKAGEVLRTQFEESAQDGADIFLPLITPPLLGETMDTVIAMTNKKSDSASSYGWAEAAATYGWRP